MKVTNNSLLDPRPLLLWVPLLLRSVLFKGLELGFPRGPLQVKLNQRSVKSKKCFI